MLPHDPTSSRSILVTVNNRTSSKLNVASHNISGGIYTVAPLSINAGERHTFRIESNGVATGAVGSANYTLENGGGMFEIAFSVPFLGSNEIKHTCPEGYVVERNREGGSAAEVTFIVEETRIGVEHFVGRDDAGKRLHDALTGRLAAGGNLTVQSIEGSGGIGKTFLFNHVIGGVDLSNRKYLTLRIDGNDPSRTLVRTLARMVDSAEAEAIRGRPPRFHFPEVGRVVKAIETIRSEADAEFQKLHPNNEDGRLGLGRFVDSAFAAGKRISDTLPIAKKYVNVQELKRLIEDTVSLMVSLREEAVGFFERLSIGGSTALRNSIKENACVPLANALESDLSAILKRYRTRDILKARHSKVKGIDRLLLILDDYESLKEPLGEFLVGHLLPKLRSASFQSVVIILGRDLLEATHPAWNKNLAQNLLRRITLAPLSRSEMDQMVESYGVTAHDEKERAWRDTQGYPFYVRLWIEEIASGGRTAVMLKLFYDRTTCWMSDREKRWLQHTLFLDEVNPRTLRSMLGDEQEAVEASTWFRDEGSVRDTEGSSFRVREYLRSRLRDYLQCSDPDRYEELQRLSRSAGALHTEA